MEKYIDTKNIKKVAYVIFPSGHVELLGFYTDTEYAENDILKWQHVYDSMYADVEPVMCVLMDKIVPCEVLLEFANRGLL